MKSLFPTIVALLALSPCLALGSDGGAIDSPPIASNPASDASSRLPSPAAQSTSNAAPPWDAELRRWVELRDMTFAMRFRSVFDSNNAHEYNQVQQRSIIDGKFKFDREGKYGVVFHASSGKYFNWAYSDIAGGGTQKGYGLEYSKATPIQQDAVNAYLTPERVAEQGASGGWSFYLRRLYLDVEPIPGIELQYGSLEINRGAASEITTYDYDGYITGERLLIKRPQNLFFSEISVTYAYFGDLYKPNFFVRGDRFLQANYHQFLVRKQIAKRVNASFDYTWQDKSNTLRQAVEAKIPESRVLDSVRVETYERLNAISFREVVDFAPGGKGFAITMAKRNLLHRLSLEGGLANIDPHQGVLTQAETSATFCMGVNGDAYGLGNRFFVRPSIKITPYIEVNGFYTHEIGKFTVPDQIVWNKQALNAGVVFDLRKAFFAKGVEQ